MLHKNYHVKELIVIKGEIWGLFFLWSPGTILL